jgi:hypothetical protein
MYLCDNTRTDFVFSIWGRKMDEFIWHWNQGNTIVFTRDQQRAEKAMKNGILVFGEKINSNIIRY